MLLILILSTFYFQKPIVFTSFFFHTFYSLFFYTCFTHFYLIRFKIIPVHYPILLSNRSFLSRIICFIHFIQAYFKHSFKKKERKKKLRPIEIRVFRYPIHSHTHFYTYSYPIYFVLSHLFHLCISFKLIFVLCLYFSLILISSFSI